MEAIETKKIGKYKIDIFPDQMMESPDEWENEDAFVVYDHPRYFSVKRKGFEPQDIWNHLQSGKKMYDGHFVFPLYAYIHSGIVLSVGSHNFPDARWDVSMRGFVVVKRQKGSYTNDKALELAKGITEEWNQYLSGDVYGYSITDTDTEENLDSCWGYYGLENCMKEAESIVEYQMGKDKHGQLELELKE